MIKLLVVDDEKGLCEYLRKFFSMRGYSVFTAGTAKEALCLIKEKCPELVLLDINMPDSNGFEALREIKNTSAQTKVIMVTVNDDADTRQKAKNLGADDFVKKPFTTDYLEDVVILKVNEITREKISPNILIVDDEDGIRDTLREFLGERFECMIYEAVNVEQAVNLLKKYNIDLILLDIMMPGASGIEVIKTKKKLNYKPYILVITRFDSEEVAHKVIKQGADDYIAKPLSLRVLGSKIRDILSNIGKYKPKGRPKDSGDSGR